MSVNGVARIQTIDIKDRDIKDIDIKIGMKEKICGTT